MSAVTLKNMIIDLDGMFEKTPFNLAAENGLFSVCQYMVDKIQSQEAYQDLFSYACSLCDDETNMKVCEMVIKKLKNVNFLGDEGRTELHLAAEHGVLKISKLIVEYVDDWNPKDDYGETPLDLAVKNGEIATVEFFRSLQAKRIKCK